MWSVLRSVPAGTEIDPSLSNVVLHLKGNQSPVIDSSPSPKTITVYGNASVSTTVKKFGASALAFDGNGDYLKVNDIDAFGFGTADFTSEAWVYLSNLNTDKTITDFRELNGSDGGTFFIHNQNKLAFWEGTTVLGNAGTALTIGAWYHVAVSKQSGVYRFFLDGVLQSSVSNSTNLGTDRPCGIGAAVDNVGAGTSAFNGYIDDLRITKGVARYTANFTPPAELPTTSSGATKGYALGGYNGSAGVTEIDGIRFSDETAINPAATLGTAVWDTTGVSSLLAGYVLGGGTNPSYTPTSAIQKLLFSSETASLPSATLATAGAGVCGVSSTLKGYGLGRFNSLGQPVTEIDGILFSNDASINPSAVLATAQGYGAGAQSDVKGYLMGGSSSSSYTSTANIQGITFATESAIDPSASLALARLTKAVQSTTNAYCVGGSTGSKTTEIDGLRFSDETAINPSSALSVATDVQTGVSGSTKGFILGGRQGASTNVSSIVGFTYQTETVSSQSAVLSVARNGGAGVQG